MNLMSRSLQVRPAPSPFHDSMFYYWATIGPTRAIAGNGSNRSSPPQQFEAGCFWAVVATGIADDPRNIARRPFDKLSEGALDRQIRPPSLRQPPSC